MNIEIITRNEAIEKTGMRLPAGLRWYWVTGLEWYPKFGDWSQTWSEADGLTAIIGKRKPTGIIARVVEEPERVGEVVR